MTVSPTTRAASSEMLLELNGATRFYGTVIGVNDLTLSLPVGAYGLVGPNGAGKSTLIGLITGLLKPSLGSVRLFGKNPFVSHSVLRRIGICPAQELLVTGISAMEWLAYLLKLGGFAPADAVRRAETQLARVGLANSMQRPMNEYSLGMRQRVKLAQALAHDPELLILDEPFNGLDPIGRHAVTELLRDWAASGKSILLASHVLHEVEAVTDAFLLIYGGRLLASGSAGELRSILADLPQEIVLEGERLEAVAGRLTQLTFVESLQFNEARSELRIGAREPQVLYRELLRIVFQEEATIRRISGADGDLSALFRSLTSRHQGQRR